MDRINQRLCALLQERARLAVTIATWKLARGIAIADPAREQAMLKRMLAGAPPGFDAAALSRLLRAVLRESRALALREGPRRPSRRTARGVARSDGRPTQTRRRPSRGAPRS
jgi:chorismate mutase